MSDEEIKKDFLEWCTGLLTTHTDYKKDLPFDLKFLAEAIWGYVEPTFKSLEEANKKLNDYNPKELLINPGDNLVFFVRDKDGKVKFYSSPVKAIRVAEKEATVYTKIFKPFKLSQHKIYTKSDIEFSKLLQIEEFYLLSDNEATEISKRFSE